jgi:hypothetical protein
MYTLQVSKAQKVRSWLCPTEKFKLQVFLLKFGTLNNTAQTSCTQEMVCLFEEVLVTDVDPRIGAKMGFQQVSVNVKLANYTSRYLSIAHFPELTQPHHSTWHSEIRCCHVAELIGDG